MNQNFFSSLFFNGSISEKIVVRARTLAPYDKGSAQSYHRIVGGYPD
jgi:hypothetical protein